jgi:hypothetical protein
VLAGVLIAVAVAGDEEDRERILRAWGDWKCQVPIEVLIDPGRSLIRAVLGYVESIEKSRDAAITVLIQEIIPRKRRQEILYNQRGRLLEVVLKSRTSVVVATLRFHLHER